MALTAATITLNFEELSDGASIGAHYASLGVTFDNAVVRFSVNAPTQPNFIFGSPLAEAPLTIHFAQGATSVSIQCDGDGFNSDRQPQMRVLDAGDNAIDTQFCASSNTVVTSVGPYPYLILDAGYENVREDGVIR